GRFLMSSGGEVTLPYRDPFDQDEGDLETGTRVCKGCGVRKPMTHFYRTNKKTYRRRKCKDCASQMRQDLWERDPSRKENHDRQVRSDCSKKTYGLTLEEVEGLIDHQGGCAVCGGPLNLMTSSSVTTAHVDHDHSTG